MDFTMPPLDAAGNHSTVSVIGHAVKAPNNPSKATLSASEYSISDPTIFTVAPDPNTPGGAIITAVATPGESESQQAVLTEKATANPPPARNMPPNCGACGKPLPRFSIDWSNLPEDQKCRCFRPEYPGPPSFLEWLAGLVPKTPAAGRR